MCSMPKSGSPYTPRCQGYGLQIFEARSIKESIDVCCGKRENCMQGVSMFQNQGGRIYVSAYGEADRMGDRAAHGNPAAL